MLSWWLRRWSHLYFPILRIWVWVLHSRSLWNRWTKEETHVRRRGRGCWFYWGMSTRILVIKKMNFTEPLRSFSIAAVSTPDIGGKDWFLTSQWSRAGRKMVAVRKSGWITGCGKSEECAVGAATQVRTMKQKRIIMYIMNEIGIHCLESVL